MSHPNLPPSPRQIRAQQRELNRTAVLSEASSPSQGTTVSTLTADYRLVWATLKTIASSAILDL